MTESIYPIPKWAGVAAPGLHLDVVKDGKMIQKLMIDEKKCYFFGRNPSLCDFCIDHSSCSRVHSVLVYHKHLERAFLVDLGSTHGTYIGSIRLEAQKPTQLPLDSTFHFGASTRYYTLREKPQNGDTGEANEGNLPEDELELDNLTEYNTANNKRISMVGIKDDALPRKRTKRGVIFKEEDDVINPEDIDPTVGKFRNLIQSAVIPKKKIKLDDGQSRSMDGKMYNILKAGSSIHDPSSSRSGYHPLLSNSLSIKLGIQLPNPAPELYEEEEEVHQGPEPPADLISELPDDPIGSKKKKYAKEAWPGRKPGLF